MRILTFLTDPPVISTILLHLDLPQRIRFPASKVFELDVEPQRTPLLCE